MHYMHTCTRAHVDISAVRVCGSAILRPWKKLAPQVSGSGQRFYTRRCYGGCAGRVCVRGVGEGAGAGGGPRNDAGVRGYVRLGGFEVMLVEDDGGFFLVFWWLIGCVGMCVCEGGWAQGGDQGMTREFEVM